MKLKSNLEVILLWYFANFKKELALSRAMRSKYELPFWSGYFDEEILPILIDFEKRGLIPKASISFTGNSLYPKQPTKEFVKEVKNCSLVKITKDRLLNNKFYLKDINSFYECNSLKVKFRSSIWKERIAMDLKGFKYPEDLDPTAAEKQLHLYAIEIGDNYQVVDINELVNLNTFLSRVDIGTEVFKKHYEEHYQYLGTEFSTLLEEDEEIILSEQDISLVIKEDIAMISFILAEMKGQIEIRRLFVTYDPIYENKTIANIAYSIVPENMRTKVIKNVPHVYKIYCSKKDERGKFYIIFNDKNDKKISLNYKHAYAKLLYEVIHEGKYTHNQKQGLDELMRRACGTATGNKATYSKYIPELNFVMFLENKGTEVFQNEAKVELIPDLS